MKRDKYVDVDLSDTDPFALLAVVRNDLTLSPGNRRTVVRNSLGEVSALAS
jgi:hypothetical protein